MPQPTAELSHLVTTMRRAAQMPAVRPAVIAQIRQEMAQDTFGGPADVERTLTALLGEFFR